MKSARVADLAEQIRGVTYSKGESSRQARDRIPPYSRASNITNAELTGPTLRSTSRLLESSQAVASKNDRFSWRHRAEASNVGKAAIAREDFIGAFGQLFPRYSVPGSDVDPDYFAHTSRLSRYRLLISSLSSRPHNINNLRGNILENL